MGEGGWEGRREEAEGGGGGGGRGGGGTRIPAEPFGDEGSPLSPQTSLRDSRVGLIAETRARAPTRTH